MNRHYAKACGRPFVFIRELIPPMVVYNLFRRLIGYL